MKLERFDPGACDTGAKENCVTDSAGYSKNAAKKQGISGAPVHLIGCPKVLVERRNGSAFVKLINRPWGWPQLDREFLNDGPGVGRYADRIRQRIAEAAWAKQEERERRMAANFQERLDRAGGGE